MNMPIARLLLLCHARWIAGPQQPERDGADGEGVGPFRARGRHAKRARQVSEYLRHRASLSCAPARKPAKVRCPHTGAMIFASPANQPPLTADAVRELLSDFP